jgi:hypothetical protein
MEQSAPASDSAIVPAWRTKRDTVNASFDIRSTPMMRDLARVTRDS